MRARLRILAALILAVSLAWPVTDLMGSGGSTAFASQSEGALALARRFETTSWLSLAGLQVIAATAGTVPALLVSMAPGTRFGVGGRLCSRPTGLVGRQPARLHVGNPGRAFPRCSAMYRSARWPVPPCWRRLARLGRFNGRCWPRVSLRRRAPSRMSGRASPRLRTEPERRRPDAKRAAHGPGKRREACLARDR